MAHAPCCPLCRRISGAFYCTVTWLPAELRKQGMKPILSQGAVIVSMLANAIGLLGVGMAFDRGMRAVHANATIVFMGIGVGESRPERHYAYAQQCCNCCSQACSSCY